MNLVFLILMFAQLQIFAAAKTADKVRTVSKTSCQVIPVNLALNVTTLVVLEQEPKTTLYADKKHFRIVNDSSSPRSLAIIPVVESSELDLFRDAKGVLPAAKALATALDRNFKTNFFVFFENNNQLMFELRFVEKEKADYILKVTQVFNEDCAL